VTEVGGVPTDRARGVLLGLACGDALGRPVEFRSAARLEVEPDLIGAYVCVEGTPPAAQFGR